MEVPCAEWEMREIDISWHKAHPKSDFEQCIDKVCVHHEMGHNDSNLDPLDHGELYEEDWESAKKKMESYFYKVCLQVCIYSDDPSIKNDAECYDECKHLGAPEIRGSALWLVVSIAITLLVDV